MSLAEDATNVYDGKPKKFSKRETQLILQVVDNYIATNNLQLTDVCRSLRDYTEDERRVKLDSRLWKELAENLPNRTIKVLI